ncbi:HgcAB-associated protein HgcC [Methanoregula sp.]|uniref:HgcAB-associated protein HgcC n=1 Tax=Methanoregula sp. TaxID=2052170 RepID=UPI002C8D03F2|nr:HgcAB-associated protein [Methanoregula sp.]HVP96796.1 HgcAB-associated protein [Methanoregula sp.]
MAKKKEIHVTGDLETSVCKCGPDAVCRLEAVLSIDERGQMVLPKDVREKIGAGAGEKFALVSWGKEGKICCLALTRVENLNDPVRDLLGPMIRGED